MNMEIFLSVILLICLLIFLLRRRFFVEIGEHNRIGYYIWSVRISSLISLYRRYAGKRRGNKKRRKSKPDVKKMVRFLPSSGTAISIVRRFREDSITHLDISSGDPFWDGILSGVKYATGTRGLDVQFRSGPWFRFLWSAPAFMFVKIGVIWIIDIIRKEVRNVLH